MADEAPENEQPEDVETTEQEPQEGAEQDDSKDEGGDFDATKALEKIRKLNSENKNLREAKKVAEEKAAGSDEKDKRVLALEAEVRRVRIGAKHGLPEELIDRLRGDTEEEILADAETLLALVARRTPPTGKPTEHLRGGGGQPAEPDETDPDKIAERMFRR